MFAIVSSLLLLQNYFEGCRSTVRSNHDNLKCILHLSDSTGKLTGWQMRLVEFTFDIVTHVVTKHQAIDTLSRLRTAGEDKMSIEDDIPTVCFTPGSALKEGREVYVKAGI